MTLRRGSRCTPQHQALAHNLLSLPLAICVLAAASLPVAAQQAATTACGTTADLAPAQLYGRWQFSLWPQSAAAPSAGVPPTGTITFERHPEFPDSVRGRLRHQSKGQSTEALVSGDVVNGEFNLDESADGQRIDAAWMGNISPDSCSKEIRGVRLPGEGQTGEPMNFVLKKAPGWD